MIQFYTCPMTLKIRALRIAAGLSQQMLAEKAGISRSQLSEIETEAKPANTLRLNSIASALGVQVEDLFESGARQGYIMELEGLLDRMTDEDRDAIIRLAKSLARQQ